MCAFDVRWARLAVAAGAIVGSALVSSVAVATDESPPIDPPPTETTDIGSVDVDQSSAEVIVVDPPPPFEDIAVIEIVLPDPEMIDPEMIDPEVIDPEATEPAVVEMARHTAPDNAALLDESTVDVPFESMPASSLMMAVPETQASAMEEPVEGHQGGSGGQGTPNRMTFTVIWYDSAGTQIGDLDLVLPAEWRDLFELSATSRTGQGMPTSATCTYPDDTDVLQCVFDNPGHGSGTGLVVPARPTATYAVTVDWNVPDWTIEGANDGPYSARDLCPRGAEGGGHEGGGEEGGGHEEGGEEGGGHEESGEAGGEEGGEEGGGIPCEHKVVMRQVVPGVQTPSAPPAVQSEAVQPVVTPPTVTPAVTEPVVESVSAAPRSLPTTGGSVSMIVLMAGVLIAVGSALAGLTRRTS